MARAFVDGRRAGRYAERHGSDYRASWLERPRQQDRRDHGKYEQTRGHSPRGQDAAREGKLSIRRHAHTLTSIGSTVARRRA
jgi:hypothetical protein